MSVCGRLMWLSSVFVLLMLSLKLNMVWCGVLFLLVLWVSVWCEVC